jgi:hypothetical protein
MIRKFPAKQWTRQSVILFHEIIPLKTKYFSRNFGNENKIHGVKFYFSVQLSIY